MAEDAVAASTSLPQILTVSVRYCGPAFVSWLSMLWGSLTRNPELQSFGISPQFWLKVSRGDEGVGHVCFPGDEGVGRPWRGYRCVQMDVGPALYLELLLNLALCIYFWIQNLIQRFHHMLIWSFCHSCIKDWPGKRILRAIAFNSFSLRVTSLHMLANTNCLVNIIDYSAIHLHGYQRLFQNLKCALIAILPNAISIYLPDFM